TGKLFFADHLLPGNAAGQETEYSQVSGQFGTVWQRSQTLADLSLPLPQNAAKKLAPGKVDFQETTLKPGLNVQVATFKAGLPRCILFNRGWGPPRSQSGRQAGQSPPSAIPNERRATVFFIQVAADTNSRDQALAQFKEKYESDLVNLKAETEDSLATLRSQLFWISLITFAATMTGGFLLTRLGLSPLRRLSDAVSQISEKDIRLQFEEPKLPQELQPIVERLQQTLGLLNRAFAREKQAAADISHE